MRKIALVVAVLTASLFLCAGYANLTDILSVDGSAAYEIPDYDCVVITGVRTVSSNADFESSGSVVPTNVKSEITGTRGQRITYEITAHNFSETDYYVYTGMVLGSDFFPDSRKLDVSASKDKANSQKLINDTSAKSYEGNAVAPGENFVFYATYTLTDNLSAGEVMINYLFKPVIYTVTYLDNNAVYAQEYITDNSVAHSVRKDRPADSSHSFVGWVNANAIVINSFPAGNTNDYTLTAKWDNIYLIIFADADGTVLYEEEFTDSSTGLSAAGQAIVDSKLAELNSKAGENMTVTWSKYDIASAKSDIIVDAIYNYSGYLNIVPVFLEPDDGIVDYYRVEAVDSLPSIVEVCGNIGGVPVKVIDRITNTDGENDWDNFEKNVTTIIIHEGVEILEHNSLAWTPNLGNVKLPSTIKEMGKNTFSRNIALGGFGRGDDKKVLTIEFNGTVAEWSRIVANSDSNWDGGLKKGSRVMCSDGYFELQGTLSLSWQQKSY